MELRGAEAGRLGWILRRSVVLPAKVGRGRFPSRALLPLPFCRSPRQLWARLAGEAVEAGSPPPSGSPRRERGCAPAPPPLRYGLPASLPRSGCQNYLAGPGSGLAPALPTPARRLSPRWRPLHLVPPPRPWAPWCRRAPSL